MQQPNDARNAILEKIRGGLATSKVAKPFPEVSEVPLQTIFTKQTHSIEEQFVQEFTRLGGTFIFCNDGEELTHNIIRLADSRDWKQVMCTETALAAALDAKGLLVRSPETHIETADVCITGCEALIARTGSVLISSAQPYGRTATVYYPVHIIVAGVSQLLPDIEDGLKMLTDRSENMPSMIHLNTGPSRTADIEKTLVVGVHGPGEVILMLVNE